MLTMLSQPTLQKKRNSNHKMLTDTMAEFCFAKSPHLGPRWVNQYNDQTMGCINVKLWFSSLQWQDIFLSSEVSKLVLEPTQPPVQCRQGAILQAVKWMRCKVEDLLPLSANVKAKQSFICTPPCAYIACTAKVLPLSSLHLKDKGYKFEVNSSTEKYIS